MQTLLNSKENMGQKTFLNNYIIKDVMNTDLTTLTPFESLKKADELMQLKVLSHIPIVDEDHKLVGLITKRDILRATCSYLKDNSGKCERGRLLEDIPIHEIMRGGLITISPNDSLKTAASLMSNNNIGSLPVIDSNDKLIGIITSSDFIELFCSKDILH